MSAIAEALSLCGCGSSLPSPPVLELWGMTELAGAATFNPYWGDNKPGTIGLPMPGMSCKIVDVENAAHWPSSLPTLYCPPPA